MENRQQIVDYIAGQLADVAPAELNLTTTAMQAALIYGHLRSLVGHQAADVVWMGIMQAQARPAVN